MRYSSSEFGGNKRSEGGENNVSRVFVKRGFITVVSQMTNGIAGVIILPIACYVCVCVPAYVPNLNHNNKYY